MSTGISTILDSTSGGLKIITDQMRDVQTVTIAIGTKIGARNENEQQNGISHFLEHMAFKVLTRQDSLKRLKRLFNSLFEIFFRTFVFTENNSLKRICISLKLFPLKNNSLFEYNISENLGNLLLFFNIQVKMLLIIFMFSVSISFNLSSKKLSNLSKIF